MNKTNVQNTVGSIGTVLGVVGNEKTNESFGVMSVNPGSGQTLATTSEFVTYMKTKSSFTYVSDKTLAIDGVQGVEVIMKDNSTSTYYQYAYWIKNGKGYLALLSSPNNTQQQFESIASSVKTS